MWYPLLTSRGTRGALLAVWLFLSGCGKNDGLSDNDRRMLAIKNANEDLKSKGAKIELRKYPQGQASAVNLSGMEINEQVLRQVKSLGNISELNLSKTNLNDDLLILANQLDLCILCLKLDLSNTAITDAGFQKLENIRFLSEMNLSGTKVSRSAVEAFKKKRASDTTIPEIFRKPRVRVD